MSNKKGSKKRRRSLSPPPVLFPSLIIVFYSTLLLALPNYSTFYTSSLTKNKTRIYFIPANCETHFVCYRLFSIVVLDHCTDISLCRDHIHSIPHLLRPRPPLSSFPLVTCIPYLQHPPPFVIRTSAAMGNTLTRASIPVLHPRPPSLLLFRLRRVLPQRTL